MNNRLASLQTSGANMSQQAFNSAVGITVNVSLTVTGRNRLSNGGGEHRTNVEMLRLIRAS